MIKSTALPVRAKETTKAKPTQKKTEIVLETTGNEVHMAIDTRRYRIRGLEKNHSSQQLKVNILANRDELVHLDTLDLFKARSRNSFIKATATELFTDEQVIRHDIGTMLLRLEQLQGGRLRREASPGGFAGVKLGFRFSE